MKLASQRDFFSGLMFTAVGGAFAWGANSYDIGTAARMGPGYFPLMLGVLLAILGALVTISSMRAASSGGDPVGAFAWRPLGFVIGANLAFGVLLVGLPTFGIPAMGFIVAIYALAIIASMARKGFNLKEALILGTLLAVFSWVAFVQLLSLQFPVWPAFISQ